MLLSHVSWTEKFKFYLSTYISLKSFIFWQRFWADPQGQIYFLCILTTQFWHKLFIPKICTSDILSKDRKVLYHGQYQFFYQSMRVFCSRFKSTNFSLRCLIWSDSDLDLDVEPLEHLKSDILIWHYIGGKICLMMWKFLKKMYLFYWFNVNWLKLSLMWFLGIIGS